jgi:hypothetical protein
MRPARRHMPLVLGLMSVILLGVTTAWAAGTTVSLTSLSFGSVVAGTTPPPQQVTVSQKGAGSTEVKVSFRAFSRCGRGRLGLLHLAIGEFRSAQLFVRYAAVD